MVAPADVVNRTWPLTGRAEALEAVASALVDGVGAVLVTGEPGTGKTRLVREVLQRLASEGWPTATATATASGRSLPLGALAHLVPASAVDSPPQLFSDARDALEAMGGDRPVVVHVDDVHHLDDRSADLLVALAEAGCAQFALTVRTGAAVPAAVDRLRSADEVPTVTLAALDEVATDTLLHRVLGGPLDGVAAADLYAVSGGNPAFLRDLVRGAVADASLVEVAGVWRLSGPWSLKGSLADRIAARLADLPDGAREALELVAVGEPVGLDLLETMVPLPVLEALEERSLIRIDVDRLRHEVRVTHPVYREHLRTSLGRIRLRRLARFHIDALEATGARRADDDGRIVCLQLEAGMAPDADRAMTAARRARNRQDWTETARLSAAAHAGGDADAAALLVEAHFALGEFDDGDAVARRALADAGALSEEALVQLHRARSDSIFFGEGDSAKAVAEMERVAAGVGDPVLREMLLFARAAMLVWSGRVAEASSLVEGLLDSAEPRVAVQAAMIAEVVAATCGPAGRAVELADHWYPIHVRLPDLSGTNNPGFHLVIKTVALANAGRIPEAIELAELGYRASVTDRNLVGQMWFASECGRISLMRGDAVSAQRWFREQVSLCRATGWRRPVTLGLSGLAVAEALRGDAAAAARAAEECRAAELPVIELFATEAARGQAWALAAAGDMSGARRLLIEGAEEAEAAGITLMAALLRFDAVRLGDPDQTGPLARAAETVDSAIVDLAARWASGRRDGAELDEVSAGLEALGCLMWAAEAAVAAGAAWRSAGRTRSATAAEQRADDLARRCRGATSPALVTVDTVVPLTAREREIAMLVAGGLATKEVAERLFLSARTVSNHLQNAYTKLGVSRRTDLAAALNRLGIDAEAS